MSETLEAMFNELTEEAEKRGYGLGKEEGRNEGRDEKAYSLAKKWIGRGNMSDQQIADDLDVSLAFVENVRNKEFKN